MSSSDELYEVDSKDKLVLYFEEIANERPDTYCYVMYDFTEKEYFLCGARHDSEGTKYGKFHFYCRSSETVLDYLTYILNISTSDVTQGLYNFRNLFEHSDCVDLDILDAKKTDINELSVYIGEKFKTRLIKKLLRMLKEIRY